MSWYIICQSVQVAPYRDAIQPITAIMEAVVAAMEGGTLTLQQAAQAATETAASAGDGGLFLNHPLDGLDALIDEEQLAHEPHISGSEVNLRQRGREETHASYSMFWENRKFAYPVY